MATELGKAYVQIIPSARGISGKIQQAIGGDVKSAGKTSGRSLGRSLASVATKVIAAAGIGKAIGASLRAGGALEQSIGGVETLFKGSADKVVANARRAYRTAGISANSYMENVTSFSASLLQSLGGDTEKATKIADMAMIDMADNMNKMGTPLQNIQDAYQGFAKQNYTMLDNLKLGYGGTKTEMERLLADAQKLTGVKYDINNLSDVYEAIHVIQENLGITGTTAKEAEETLTGSFMAMKASAENVLGNMALGENLKPSLIDLADTAATFLFGNFIPMLTEIVKNIPTMIATLIEAGAPHILNAGKTLINNLGLGIEESLSSMDFSGIKTFFESLFSALSNAFDILMSYVAPAIERLVESFVNLWNAAQPIISLLSELLMPVFEIVATFIGEVFTVAVDILTTAFDMLAVALELLTPVFEFLIDLFNLISPALSTVADWVIWVAEKFGILSFSSEDLKTVTEVVWPAIKNAIETAKTSINNAIEKIKNTYESLKEKGTNLKESISQVWQSIQNKINSVKGAIGRAIERVKNIFNDLVSSGNRLKDSLSQAWSKIQSAVETAKGKIEGSINRIKGLFESLGNINLFSAGKAILDGFLRGLKSAWGRVKNFVGGIAGWIKDHKGPISYDRRLLIPAGRAIMGSLDKGLTKYFSDVKSTVSSMGQQIADEMTSSFGNMDGQLAYADAQFNHTLRSEVVSPQDKLGEVLNAMLPKFSPEVVVTLDGREIARASRDYTDEELENKRYQENFGTGGRF